MPEQSRLASRRTGVCLLHSIRTRISYGVAPNEPPGRLCRNHCSESGAILVEAALASAFLIVFCMMLVDTVLVIHAHATMNQAAHEGGRLAARIKRLASIPTPYTAKLIRDRTAAILDDANWLRVRNVTITARCNNVALAGGHAMPTVEVRIGANYRALLAPFDSIPLNAVHTATYLAGDACL